MYKIVIILTLCLASFNANAGMFTYMQASNAASEATKVSQEVARLQSKVEKLDKEQKEIKEILKRLEKLLIKKEK